MKKWKIEAIDDGERLKIHRYNEEFSLFELIGITEIIRRDLLDMVKQPFEKRNVEIIRKLGKDEKNDDKNQIGI